jgi:hypothetical protein
VSIRGGPPNKDKDAPLNHALRVVLYHLGMVGNSVGSTGWKHGVGSSCRPQNWTAESSHELPNHELRM